MKIIRVEEHPTDLATDKAARPAVLGEASYFGLMDSPTPPPGRAIITARR